MTFERALNDFVITSCQFKDRTYTKLDQFDYKKYLDKEGQLMVDNKADGFIFIFKD